MEKVRISDPMRLFTLVVSPIFVGIGVMAIASGNSDGWLIAGFFGLCLLVAVFEPWFSKPWVTCDYRLVMTTDEVACEHPRRPRESIRWDDVNRIWYVTTSHGQRLPDEWLLLEGAHGGCSFPTEAKGFEGIWDELQQRFAGFDYGPLIRGGTDEAKHLCWERTRERSLPVGTLAASELDMERDYSSLLPQVLGKLFPDPSAREHAARILSSYGRESFHLEVERVHLGILKLSGADLSAIERWTQFACDDFRDLLIEAEYRLSFGKDRLRVANPQEYNALKKKEHEQYDAWIAKILAD